MNGAASPALGDRKARAIVRSVIEYHLGGKPERIVELTGGLSNHVYSVRHAEGAFIVRFSPAAEKIQEFLKEQWVIGKARAAGVPTAEILQVGTEPVSVPYVIARKAKGREATHHPERFAILREMGRLTALVHGIATSGYGTTFDWSQNVLSRNATWADFLRTEVEAGERLERLSRHKMLSREQRRALAATIERMCRWKDAPALHHGDMRLKNVLVDEAGEITAIIDWEHCLSSIPPYWDLAIALHDLSVDAKEMFLDGYGLEAKEIRAMSPYIAALNVLNYAGPVEAAAEAGDERRLAQLGTRLCGALDLYGQAR